MHLVGHLSFSAILQAAAARAWVRNASSAPKLPSRSVSKPLVKSRDIPLAQYLQRHRVSAAPSQTPTRTPKRPSPRTSHVVYFDPDAVCDSDLHPPLDSFSYDPVSPELDSTEHPEYWDDASIIGTTVGSWDPGVKQLGTRSTHFPLAKNRSSLYQNLLRLLLSRDHPPSITVLMDYHDLHPGLRSTRSYNLLISLAIRTASYGTVRWLIQSMRADNLPGNHETWKLRVRWLVQSGMWDKAWKETVEMFPPTEGGKNTSALPLHIWMEFFRTLKYGTTQVRSRRKQALTSNAQVSTPSESTSPSASDSSELYSTRYHTLMNNRPTIIPHELSKTSPKFMYHAVWTMLHVGQADMALSLTKSYFESLPRLMTVSWYKRCIDILHILIAKWSSQRGLRRFYETRRMMVSLLRIYPTLRPTSTTLFLLLAPLYRVKRCGTVAANVLRTFKSDYGARTEDRRVRRRVVNLALKEGRMDIVNKILRAERSARRAYAAWRSTRRVTGAAAKPLPQKLLRPPTRKIFRGNGQEEQRWCRLLYRVSRTRRRIRRRNRIRRHNRTK